MILTKFSSLLLLASVSAQATTLTDPNNVYMHTGDSAKYDGILMPVGRAQRVLEQEYNLGACTKISSLKDEENALITQRLTNAQSENDRLALQLERDRTDSFWTKTLYFMGGSLITGLIAYGSFRLVR